MRTPETTSGETTVVVDSSGKSYHDPQKINAAFGMDSMTEQEAYDEGAVACSKCFPHQSINNYPFPFWRGPVEVLASKQDRSVTTPGDE